VVQNDAPRRPRKIQFRSLAEKAAWLDANASLDADLTYVRGVATRFARAFDPNDHEGLARSLHRFVRDGIRYVPDPGEEEFADSETILKRGFDDCDGKSRLFVALCRAVGLEARIVPVFKKHPYSFVHVQTEVRWPGSQNVKGAEPGGWLLGELILKNCALGESPDAVPRAPDGSRVLT